jgi:hypothetical protein
VVCETLIIHRAELERVIIVSGFSVAAQKRDYVVLAPLTDAPGAEAWLVTSSWQTFESTWPISRNT